MALSSLYALSSLSCLLLISSFFQISSVNSVRLPPNSSDKVLVGLYYTSVGKGSAEIITELFPLIFKNGLISIVDLHLSPLNISQFATNETYFCQGNEKECYMNTIEACAIKVWSDVAKHFNFIECIESKVLEGKLSKWETCFDLLKLDRAPIDECYNSGLGTELEKKNAEETRALKPQPEFTSWVVVNGKPIRGNMNTMYYICQAYKGPSPPEACKNKLIITSPSIREIIPIKYYKDNVAEAMNVTRSKMIYR